MNTCAELDIEQYWHFEPPVKNSGFRRRVYRLWIEKFGNACPECGEPMVPAQGGGPPKEDAPTIDHIVAQALSGTDELDNLRVICWLCNFTKSKEEAAQAYAGRWTKRAALQRRKIETQKARLMSGLLDVV